MQSETENPETGEIEAEVEAAYFMHFEPRWYRTTVPLGVPMPAGMIRYDRYCALQQCTVEEYRQLPELSQEARDVLLTQARAMPTKASGTLCNVL